MDSFEELSIKAYKDDKISEDNNIIDKYYYIKLKELYLDYKCGKINKEKAEIKKKKLRNGYYSEKEYYEKYLNLCKEYNNNRIQIEYDLSKIEKSKDKDEILKLALDILSKITYDKNLVERNIDKLTF